MRNIMIVAAPVWKLTAARERCLPTPAPMMPAGRDG
jgi:hypothetical protein